MVILSNIHSPLLLFVVCVLALVSGSATKFTHHAGEITEPTIVDATCGECLFALTRAKSGCDLAMRLDGKS